LDLNLRHGDPALKKLAPDMRSKQARAAEAELFREVSDEVTHFEAHFMQRVSFGVLDGFALMVGNSAQEVERDVDYSVLTRDLVC
jgi:hypothetical protein